MWYFSWVLGKALACSVAIASAVWLETSDSVSQKTNLNKLRGTLAPNSSGQVLEENAYHRYYPIIKSMPYIHKNG